MILKKNCTLIYGVYAPFVIFVSFQKKKNFNRMANIFKQTTRTSEGKNLVNRNVKTIPHKF